MQILQYSSHNIDKLISLLSAGGIVIFPTETVYALSCDATNHSAVEKIYRIKSRSNHKPLSLLVHNIDVIKKYSDISKETEQIIHNFSPGPLTYVLDIKPHTDLAENLSTDNTIGFRIPDHQYALEIL